MRRSRISIPKRFVALLAVTLGFIALSTTPASAGGTHATHTRVERFVLVQTDPNAAAPTIVAFGPIHARGTDTVIDDTHDVFTFPAGALNVTHTPKHSHQTFDPVTCYGTFTERGTFKVTSGTGAYTHARGHGDYNLQGTFIGCDQNAAPEVFSLMIRASGPLHL